MPQEEQEIDDKKDAVPFTARIMAHYRATESKRDSPLIVDPFAERLAGDMVSYFEEHKRTAGTGDYPIVRAYYIEKNLLTPWCSIQKESQIVLLGAGLETRAYRFKPLQTNAHTVFEIDFPVVNRYKEEILKDDTTLCKLIRVSVDLSTSEWTDQLTACGFSPDIPTFWILEGLVYYLEWETVNSVLRETVRVSAEDSQIFVDVGIPALADLVFGPFTRHFKWGMNKEDVPAFFAAVGWDVSCSFADDHDQGRDVGQKGLIFVHGTLNRQLAIDEDSMVPKPVSSEDVTLAADDPELQTFAGELTARIIPEVEGIVEAYKRDPAEGLSDYLEFVKRVKPSVERIAKGQHILSLGKISPRLLGNPLSIESADDSRTPEEEESHVTGYLKAILQLVYCGAKGVEGWQFVDTPLHEESQKTRSVGRIDTLLPMVRIVKQELVNKQDQT